VEKREILWWGTVFETPDKKDDREVTSVVFGQGGYQNIARKSIGQEIGTNRVPKRRRRRSKVT